MRDSLLSSSSNYTNYRGLLNLCIILLVRSSQIKLFVITNLLDLFSYAFAQVVSNARVALENVIKYGILVDPRSWMHFLVDPTVLPSLLILLSLNASIFLSFLIERFWMAQGRNEIFGRILIFVHLALLLLLPPYYVFRVDCHPVALSIALGNVSIIFLKLISYHMVNHWLRADFRKRYRYNGGPFSRYTKRQRSFSSTQLNLDSSSLEVLSLSGEKLYATEADVSFPDNLTFFNIYYFIMAPTLCYELNFPRSQRIRKRFLLRRLFEMVLSQLITIDHFQYPIGLINPNLVSVRTVVLVSSDFGAYSAMDRSHNYEFFAAT
jgi:diacylglycerol O-acyltransferase-1